MLFVARDPHQRHDDDSPHSEFGRRFIKAERAVIDAVSGIMAAAAAVRDVVVLIGELARSDWRGSKLLLRGGILGGGITFAANKGFNIEFVSDRDAVAVGVAVVSGIPLLVAGFLALGGESKRRDERQEAEQPVPDFDAEMTALAERRRALRPTRSRTPSLEKRPFVAEVLDDQRRALAAGKPPLDVTFLLVRGVPGGRYKVVATRGKVEDYFSKGEYWTRNEVLSTGVAFAALFAPYEYFHTAIHFDIGAVEYFLVAFAGAKFSEGAELRVCRAATALVLLTRPDPGTEDWRTVLAAEGLL